MIIWTVYSFTMEAKLWLSSLKLEKQSIRKIFLGDFIAECRAGYVHDYDIVEGPMADDTIWNFVNDYLAGNINRKAFWELAAFKHPTHQISFHSLKALDCLTFVKGEQISNE